jgi:hypothetical protein
MRTTSRTIVVPCAVIGLVLAACGESRKANTQDATAHGAVSQPPPAQNVDAGSGAMVGNCTAQGFSGGSLTGLGASYPDFAKAHPSASSEGVRTRCTPENYVSFISIKPATPLSEAKLLADKTTFTPYLPSDAVRTKTTTGHISSGAVGCRILHYQSGLLAMVDQAHSQNGQFVVVFESPPNAYSRTGITDIFVDLTGDLGGC